MEHVSVFVIGQVYVTHAEFFVAEDLLDHLINEFGREMGESVMEREMKELGDSYRIWIQPFIVSQICDGENHPDDHDVIFVNGWNAKPSDPIQWVADHLEVPRGEIQRQNPNVLTLAGVGIYG